MLPRNLIPSLIPAALVICWLLTSLPRRAAIPALGSILLVLLVGAIESLEPSNRRTPYRAVASFIDARAHTGDAVVQQFFFPTTGAVANDLRINLARPYPVFQSPVGVAHAWRTGLQGAHVFYVLDLPGVWKGLKSLSAHAGPGNRLVRVAQARYVGLDDVLVAEYRLGSSIG